MEPWIKTVATVNVNGQTVEKQQATLANGEIYTQFVSDITTKPSSYGAIRRWYKNIAIAVKQNGYQVIGTMGIGYSAWKAK